MGKLLWQPSDDIIEKSNMMDFIKTVNREYRLDFHTYQDLYNWSISHIEEFWKTVYTYTNVRVSTPYSSIVVDLEKFPPKTKWFPDAKLNFAENLLKFNDDHPAIIFKRENEPPMEISFKELNLRVSRVASSLRKINIKQGDRIVGYMPNIPETVIAMLAATSIGAIWSSCGVELGSDAALDRLGQIEPKVLFSVDAYLYKGTKFDQIKKLKHVVEGISSLKKVIVLPYIENTIDLSSFGNAVNYNDFQDKNPPDLSFEQVSFDHPLYVMFSSGTTGKPKCMVQGTGGVLINHLKELILHTNLRREDRILYLASPSWMMWNWLVTGLAVGSTIVLFDGNPLYPDWKTIWKFIEDFGITIFGCSASYIHYLKSQKVKPGTLFDLTQLTQISQTGSALSDEGFDFVYENIKSDIHLNSISGGTDINGCFAAGNPILPVYSGQLQAIALGMKVKSYNVDGQAEMDTQGELICELPSPSMPIYFWNDPENIKYHKAYFDNYDDRLVWRHGDYIEILSETGGVTFYGRSDAVLKPSGVRIGTAEIYNIVETLPEIDDSLAIGQLWRDDQRVLLFIQLATGEQLNEILKRKIKNNLRKEASPRHVPALIIQVPDIPYTFSGKKVESAVTNIINNKLVTNRDALRNPESLDFYANLLPQLQD